MCKNGGRDKIIGLWHTQPRGESMDINQLDSYLKARLSPQDYKRSQEVMELMGMAAGKYGIDPHTAKYAGLAHRISRQLTEDQLIGYLYEKEPDLMRRLPPEYHRKFYLTGPASAWMNLLELDERSDLVFCGLKEHTFLFNNPSLLGKCLFLATVICRVTRDDIRAAVLMQKFLSGNVQSALKALNPREVISLERTGNVRRLARITNPNIGEI